MHAQTDQNMYIESTVWLPLSSPFSNCFMVLHFDALSMCVSYLWGWLELNTERKRWLRVGLNFWAWNWWNGPQSFGFVARDSRISDVFLAILLVYFCSSFSEDPLAINLVRFGGFLSSRRSRHGFHPVWLLYGHYWPNQRSNLWSSHVYFLSQSWCQKILPAAVNGNIACGTIRWHRHC